MRLGSRFYNHIALIAITCLVVVTMTWSGAIARAQTGTNQQTNTVEESGNQVLQAIGNAAAAVGTAAGVPLLAGGGSAVAAANNPQSDAPFGRWIAQILYVFTVGLGAGVAYIAAAILNIAVHFSLNSAAYAFSFITIGWTMLRDVANLGFILILVYIAITVMLKADTAETMKRLAMVIFIALIINFSFFLTRVVIDAGNLIAVQFYNIIPTQTLADSSGQGGFWAGTTAYFGAGEETKDLTFAIMQGLDLETALNSQSFSEFTQQSYWWTELIVLSILYLAIGIMFFMLAAAFFTVGFKFIARTVVLWFAIIASPLALLARTMKPFEKLYKKWQDALLAHAFYPAVFLFVFYILTIFMVELNAGGSLLGNVFTDLNTVSNQPNTNLLRYITAMAATIGIRVGVVIIILYIGLKVTDQMNIWFTGAAQGFSRFATRGLNNLAYGLPALGMRTTAGRFAQNRYANMSKEEREGRAGQALNTLRLSSFDLRNVPGIQGKGRVRELLSSTGFGLGSVDYDMGGWDKERRKAFNESRKLDNKDGKSKKETTAGTPAPQPATPPRPTSPQTPPPANTNAQPVRPANDNMATPRANNDNSPQRVPATPAAATTVHLPTALEQKVEKALHSGDHGPAYEGPELLKTIRKGVKTELGEYGRKTKEEENAKTQAFYRNVKDAMKEQASTATSVTSASPEVERLQQVQKEQLDRLDESFKNAADRIARIGKRLEQNPVQPSTPPVSTPSKAAE